MPERLNATKFGIGPSKIEPISKTLGVAMNPSRAATCADCADRAERIRGSGGPQRERA
jgi:hypothetical protein